MKQIELKCVICGLHLGELTFPDKTTDDVIEENRSVFLDSRCETDTSTHGSYQDLKLKFELSGLKNKEFQKIYEKSEGKLSKFTDEINSRLKVKSVL